MSIEATTDHVRRGDEALGGGDWEGARAAFEAAVGQAPTAHGHEGLGRALWWLHDIDGAISQMERAYAAYREEPDPGRAAACALWLAREFSASYGLNAVSGGWLARAEGLLRDAGDVPEQGWLALTHAERSAAPQDMRPFAETALEMARRLGDADLEAAALIRDGYADVASGSSRSAWPRWTRHSPPRPAERFGAWRRSATSSASGSRPASWRPTGNASNSGAPRFRAG